MSELRPGQRLGPYAIERLLGKGGMGAVYLATDHSLDRKVALKVLPERLAADGSIVARFQREARALAKLRHPNLMHIYTVGEHEGRPFFAMEYIAGSTLNTVLARTGPMPPAQAVHIAAEVLAALDKVHKAGLIHRDIKPGNIMIDEDGRAVLMDFGLARQEQEEAALTADHTVLGTPSYMSPEQANGEHLDARADVYSLGIVLFEMLTGLPPFKGKTSFEVLRQQIESSVPAPSAVRSDVPPELDAVVARAVAKSPADRYQGVREMAAELAQVQPNATLMRLLDGTETGAATVQTRRPLTEVASTVRLPGTVVSRRPVWSRRWVRAGAVAAAIVVAALLAWTVFGPRPGSVPPPTPKSEPKVVPTPGASVGQMVEVRRGNEPVIRGRLISIKIIDDGTTMAKIEMDGADGATTIGIEEGDELRAVNDR